MDTSLTRQPKQARAIRTRERILDQAEQAFAGKGFDVASLTSDILDPAGISVGSFYHQFADKRAVLHAVVNERPAWREVSERLRAATEHRSSLTETVRHGLLELYDTIDEHPGPWWIHFRELHSADPDVRELIEQSWVAWTDTLHAVLQRPLADAAAASGSSAPPSAGRSAFATLGLTGVLRAYLVADDDARSTARGPGLDDVVTACVASLTG